MKKDSLSFIIILGFSLGLLRVIIDFLPRILNASPLVYYSSFLIALIVEVIVIWYAIKKTFRIKNTISILNTIKIGVLIMLITGACYSVMAYIYDTQIDPDFQKNLAIDFAANYAPETLDQVKLNFENANQKISPIGIITYTIWFIFLGTVISILSASILHSKNRSK
ncbi:DUF4199 domain-containing protein [Aquimarina brevivitae]|uniref:Uncharacterized protein DUF4199 n=1 Tax=Aquimarina brevivitae TaxID=323412 RepID=A0A4Q7P2A4_9FLAO|nr:DUF4199 domain-containing protein [Aquimarina brevivitae]RZS93468.1 uncharacterized protein DUF4199 [Aquimarina brevivitae]